MMNHIICNNDTVAEIRIWLLQALRLIEHYRWIIDSYVSDFFVGQKWEKVNINWRDSLNQMEPSELVSMLETTKQPSRHVWPLSLLAYKAATQALSLPRQPLSTDALKNILHRCSAQPMVSEDKEKIDDGNHAAAEHHRAVITNGQSLSLDHCYRRHVKPKKQHEIQGLAQAVSCLSIATQCSSVVDVGAGHGHLSRLLAFGYGLNVTALEASSLHAPKAQKFDKEVAKDIIKVEKRWKSEKVSSSLTDQDASSPSHVVCRIEPDISVLEFLSIINESRNLISPEGSVTQELTSLQHSKQPELSTQTEIIAPSNSDKAFEKQIPPFHDDNDAKQSSNSHQIDSPKDNQCLEGRHDFYSKKNISTRNLSGETMQNKFILTGLHACGDLSPTLLRLFTQCSECVALASVACCYMKLSYGSQGSGYPMSGAVSNMSGNHLSWEARELACHFVDCYIERLKDNPPSLRSHCYRAIAQQIILEKRPDFQHGSIKLTIKNSHQMPIERYIREVLRKLNLDDELSEDQIEKCQVQVNTWKSVVIFYILRLALAPVVESVILLDRMLYLWEQGADSYLLPIFDPLLSPRNFVLVACKR